jgi:alpha-beta hydrolase superfamily lysophospholipase
MNHSESVSTFISSNGTTPIAYYSFKPAGEVVSILQISHGMCEYIERYGEFIDFLTSHGTLVCGNDHAGHGNSITNMDDLGFFSEHLGYECLTEDLKKMTDLIRSEYPVTPYFILGHSMGSFVLRDYISKYAEGLSGVIISGTGGKNPLASAGLGLASIIEGFKGPRYHSKMFNSVFFNGFTSHFRDEPSEFSWLTRDKQIVESYARDPKCNFIFTMNGFTNLLQLIKKVTASGWTKSIPTSLPILMISGKEDPVGNYGKGVSSVYAELREAGFEDLKLKLYEGGRHEMLNELNRLGVFQDIETWMKG